MNIQQTTETWGNEDLSWLGSAHGVEMAKSVTIDRATATAAWLTDGVIPAGAVLRKNNASGKWRPFGDAGADGEAGLLVGPVQTGASGDPVGAVMQHGKVITAKLPATSGYVAGVNATLPNIIFI